MWDGIERSSAVKGKWRAAARIVAAALVCGAAVALFAVRVGPWGLTPLFVGVGLAFAIDRTLGKDLSLIAIAQLVLASVSLHADLSDEGIARFTLVLGAAVVLPYLVSRYAFGDDTIRFPLRGGWKWTKAQWSYIAITVIAGYLLLPAYFIGSGSYRNWPSVETGSEISRLFVGVNAVGIWDELFFIATVFALLRRHFPMWLANVLQATVFVSFLWELGYRSWGPALTIPFALVQAWIFSRTKSLPYVVTVHLIFDAVVFAVLVHAHNPELFDIFITAP